MPTFARGDTSIHYEVYGTGYPILLFAPGGLRSSIPFWDKTPFHPVRELSTQFQIIAMDQRNAGQSRAPIHGTDGWATYTADHVALLDHLGIANCHLLGGCIGGAFGLALASVAPSRISAAVLQQPIGLGGDNRPLFQQAFDGWAEELVKERPELDRAALAGLKNNLYASDFAFSVSREDVRRTPVSLLVLRGNDPYHPPEISEEIVRIAPRAELVASWKEGEDLARAVARVKAFLSINTPRDDPPMSRR
ncbi:MAG TPA: alpha/beta fold hydrolase [Polyangiaceae bacterium]|nr:alpha/beta fold hydrolase [Polyangiaceae bacterium]